KSLSYFDSSGELHTVSVSDLTSNKKNIILAVPDMYTPSCSLKHLLDFIEKVAELKAKGFHTIACVSVNDSP
ncbi:peroxiredoxin-2e-1 chloroplastic, partial [Phtheirospermum japonicum]